MQSGSRPRAASMRWRCRSATSTGSRALGAASTSTGSPHRGGGQVPLVIHGTSGIFEHDIERLARTPRIAKLNIATVLRQAFGRGLRETLAAHPQRFDRDEIMTDVMPVMAAEASRMIRLRLAGVGPTARSANPRSAPRGRPAANPRRHWRAPAPGAVLGPGRRLRIAGHDLDELVAFVEVGLAVAPP